MRIAFNRTLNTFIFVSLAFLCGCRIFPAEESKNVSTNELSMTVSLYRNTTHFIDDASQPVEKKSISIYFELTTAINGFLNDVRLSEGDSLIVTLNEQEIHLNTTYQSIRLVSGEAMNEFEYHSEISDGPLDFRVELNRNNFSTVAFEASFSDAFVLIDGMDARSNYAPQIDDLSFTWDSAQLEPNEVHLIASCFRPFHLSTAELDNSLSISSQSLTLDEDNTDCVEGYSSEYPGIIIFESLENSENLYDSGFQMITLIHHKVEKVDLGKINL